MKVQVDGFDMIVSGLLIGVPLTYLALQIIVLVKWSGGFQFGATLPIPAWGVWGALLMQDLSRDPTSHNLFPFEILIGSLASLAYLGILAAARGIGRMARA
jgi:hypothetical protein